jgi:hypothetical protein
MSTPPVKADASRRIARLDGVPIDDATARNAPRA